MKQLTIFKPDEIDALGADIRNKLSPPKNLVAMLELYFSIEEGEKKEGLLKYIKAEMTQTKINVEYLANLL